MGNLRGQAIRTAPIVEGEVKNITEFGLFIGLDGDVDGMVHLSDIDWKRSGEEAIKDYKKGDMVKAVVLDVDREKERISLGIKQLSAPTRGHSRPVRSRRATPSPAKSSRSKMAASKCRSPAPT